MFHLSNLGAFGDDLKKVADIEGYVPEIGDTPDMFKWDSPNPWDDSDPGFDADYAETAWEERVIEATALKEEAESLAADWQDE